MCPEQELENKVRKNRTSVTEQLSLMKPARRNQINSLLEDLNREENQTDTGAEWKAVHITDRNVIKKELRGTKDIRRMDVIVKRTTYPSHRQTYSKTRADSVTGQKIDLKKLGKSDERNRVENDYDLPKSKPVQDPDPFAHRRFFSNDGKLLDEFGRPIEDNGGLPPHVPRDQPIGRILEQSHLAPNDQDLFGEVHSGNPDGIIEVGNPSSIPTGPGFSLEDILGPKAGKPSGGGHGGDRGRRRDSGIEVIPTDALPARGSLSRGKSARRKGRSHSLPRSRSRSRSRAPTYPNEGGGSGRPYRVNEYAESSLSSGDEARSVLHGEVDEMSTNTSDSLHHDYEHGGRQYLHRRRRSSARYDRPPAVKGHYRGPTRYAVGEQIVMPERRYSVASRPRPYSYYPPPLQIPLQRAITYHEMPEIVSPVSPRRVELRQLDLPYPNDVREYERRAELYMDNTASRERDLRDREWHVSQWARDLQERERERDRRREKRYFAPPPTSGGYARASVHYDDWISPAGAGGAPRYTH